jgi:hypothetical protein
MSIKLQKTRQVDARCSRERYLAKRFQLTRHVAAAVASLAWEARQ